MARDGRRLRRHLAFRGAVLVVLASIAWPATAAAGTLRPQDVAVVGDQPITKAEYDHWFHIAAKSGGGQVTPDPPRFTQCIAAKRESLPTGGPTTTRKQLRRQCASENRSLRDQAMQLLISFRWIRGEAEERGIAASASQVRARFRNQKRASFPKQKDYEKFLRQSGQTERDILRRVELDLLSSRIRDQVTGDSVRVSDRDVKRYYDRNRERFAVSERRDLLVVLTKTRAKAAEARARIEAGEPWATVARDLSIDPGSRSRGGRLPAVSKGQQERRFDRAVFAAKRGELNGPVRTRFGYYVFKVTRIRPARQQTLEQAKLSIVQLLISRRSQRKLDAFVEAFTSKWRARTTCRQGYRTTDCANGPSA